MTITPASSGSGAPVTTIKQSCFEKTKKPAAASYQVPSSSVIVQSPQRQQQPQFAASNRFGSSGQQIPLIFTPECRQGSLILGQVFIGTNSNFLVPVSTLIF